jgi:hypothetical protein
MQAPPLSATLLAALLWCLMWYLSCMHLFLRSSNGRAFWVVIFLCSFWYLTTRANTSVPAHDWDGTDLYNCELKSLKRTHIFCCDKFVNVIKGLDSDDHVTFVLDIKYQGLASSAFLGSKSSQIQTRMYVGTIAVLNTCSAQSQCRTTGSTCSIAAVFL